MSPIVGIKITTSTRSGPANPTGVTSARAFIAGVTERGTVTPKAVRSIVEYGTEFGTLQSYSAHMYRAATTFFEEGGSELVVCRAVGPAATAATHVFKDRTVGTALDTVTINAANPGVWGAGITVTIADGRLADSFTLSAYLGGDRVVYVRDKTTVADLVTALASNTYIKAVDMGAISVGALRIPAVTVSPVSLTGGDDKRGDLLTAGVVAALNSAGMGYGAGAVAAPGYSADLLGIDLIQHGKANRRVAILSGHADDEVSDLTAAASSLTLDGEYGGLFGPWLTIPEGSGSATVSPEGYVLGVRARVMTAQGFWQSPAGNRATARYVQGPVQAFDPDDIDTLADGHVCGITTFGNATVLYGWRSLSTNTDQFMLITARDFLNTLTEIIEVTLQPFVFETIDGTGQLLSRIRGSLIGVLQPIKDAGGVTAKYDIDGNEINPAYRVEVVDIDETTISCTVVVRLSGAAETIQVSIVKAAFNATV